MRRIFLMNFGMPPRFPVILRDTKCPEESSLMNFGIPSIPCVILSECEESSHQFWEQYRIKRVQNTVERSFDSFHSLRMTVIGKYRHRAGQGSDE